ncbi:MAG: DEAD/DEAH box helicase family protein [Clostridiales Family XIII bacterium]|jgi:predicted helicase|nr:DEAD/DEAH box helicase family protein [Clostridiales Family XIII bacterium]
MFFKRVINRFRVEGLEPQKQSQLFNNLIINFLNTYQVYDGKFKNLWQWFQFPYKQSFSHMRNVISIIAETFDGEFWAISNVIRHEHFFFDTKHLKPFLQCSGIPFEGPGGKNTRFKVRLIIDTSNQWSKEAEIMIQDLDPPCVRLTATTLEKAQVNWEKLELGIIGEKARLAPKSLRKYQTEAVDAFHKYFSKNSPKLPTSIRGKLILPSGTGKTLTALKIVEKETLGEGLVLYVTPSISSMGHALREWSENSKYPLFPICVYSPQEVASTFVNSDRLFENDVANLSLPSYIYKKQIVDQIQKANSLPENRIRVIFSTYYALRMVSTALRQKFLHFSIIICDEAHLTTGSIYLNKNEKDFDKIHDNEFLPADKRVYMTATPRIFRSHFLRDENRPAPFITSLNNPKIYGKEVYRMSFKEAVEQKYVSNYKILLLALDKKSKVANEIFNELPPETYNTKSKKDVLTARDVNKFIGCTFALSKSVDLGNGILSDIDPGVMRKTVAFCDTTLKSKKLIDILDKYKSSYYKHFQKQDHLKLPEIKCNYITGSMGSIMRDYKIELLKKESPVPNICQILANYACITTGEECPSLDAIMLLSRRCSRLKLYDFVKPIFKTAPGKKLGYIILPILLSDKPQKKIKINDTPPFLLFWEVLNAMRAHDERIDSFLEEFKTTRNFLRTGSPILLGRPIIPKIKDEEKELENILPEKSDEQKHDISSSPKHLKPARSKHPQKVSIKDEKIIIRKNMLLWAKDMSKIAQNIITQTNKLISEPGALSETFSALLKNFQRDINPSISKSKVIQMIAQHMVISPAIQELFKNSPFIQNNPVSVALEEMATLLEGQAQRTDTGTLKEFYDETSNRTISLNNSTIKSLTSKIDSASTRQIIIRDLYEKFLSLTFPDEVEELGIAHTPIEIVDFIINSVAEVLLNEFDRDIADEDIHFLDPFTRTGTFITRLIQSGYLGSKLTSKYNIALHANEMFLLPYYFASINIENAYYEILGSDTKSLPFKGICLADSFQIDENDEIEINYDNIQTFNSKRIQSQKNQKISVIFGKQPYSREHNLRVHNLPETKYPKLDDRLTKTYTEKSEKIPNKISYKNHIKALRWATDRLDKETGGIVAFFMRSGFVEKLKMDGVRKSLQDEFSSVYVLNFQGTLKDPTILNRKKSNDLSNFRNRDSSCILILVKKPNFQGNGKIYYHEIGHFVSSEMRLSSIADYHNIYNPKLKWEKIVPNQTGNWGTQRNDSFKNFIIVGEKIKENQNTFFEPYFTAGIVPRKDVLSHNFSKTILKDSIKNSVQSYNNIVDQYHKNISSENSLKIKHFAELYPQITFYDREQMVDLKNGKKYTFNQNFLTTSLYRPFQKQYCYFHDDLNKFIYQLPILFPSASTKNTVICISGLSSPNQFSTLITNLLPSYDLIGSTVCLPRYYYSVSEDKNKEIIMASGSFFVRKTGALNYLRHDAITNNILTMFTNKYGHYVTKHDIFYYIYGILHSQDYREAFALNLTNSLPRIPLLDNPNEFFAFSAAGLYLAELHLHYEDVDLYKNVKVTGLNHNNFEIDDPIQFVPNSDRTAIKFNRYITISDIPIEAYQYTLKDRSIIEWLFDAYQFSYHKASRVKNNPNDWTQDHNYPRYIFDLLLRLINVSLRTQRVIKNLPRLNFD